MAGILSWDKKPTENFEPGWFVGSEGDDGEHLRDVSGWPFSVYRKAAAIGQTDIVLCHGIQSFDDAAELATLCDCGSRIADLYR